MMIFKDLNIVLLRFGRGGNKRLKTIISVMLPSQLILDHLTVKCYVDQWNRNFNQLSSSKYSVTIFLVSATSELFSEMTLKPASHPWSDLIALVG